MGMVGLWRGPGLLGRVGVEGGELERLAWFLAGGRLVCFSGIAFFFFFSDLFVLLSCRGAWMYVHWVGVFYLFLSTVWRKGTAVVGICLAAWRWIVSVTWMLFVHQRIPPV